jgi:16S rRNA (cytosine967-C5)-methyltransferase
MSIRSDNRSRASPKRSPPDARWLAAQVVGAVLDGQSMSVALPDVLTRAAPRDRALIQQLSYGCIRWQPLLQAVFEQLVNKPLRRRDRAVHALGLIGIEQIIHTRIPDHAAVSATVDAARGAISARWAPGFLNGILRTLLREKDALLHKAASMPAGRYAHPDWLYRRIREAWPDDYERILLANNAPPPMTMRVALDRMTRADYLVKLASAGLAAEPHAIVPSALVLATACDVAELPGFPAGLVSVQDAGAQLAAPLLQLREGHRVLDACAAPGGKTGHLLETEPGLAELLAVDLEPHRLERVKGTLRRLGRSANTLVADVGKPEHWWNGQLFDRILLDVPCSATGVIRRHPDIKLLRREADFDQLSTRQRKILRQAWTMLAPGGLLLYATCSIMPEENAELVSAFLDHHDDATADCLAEDWGRECGPGRQILPGESNMDGFFYARLRKSVVASSV